MALEILDWCIVAFFMICFLGIAVFYAKKGNESVEGYFLGGRKLPWWIAGTSMVATTFAADTPLLITEIVSKNGISGNWLWWNGMIGGMLTAFFFARLWRKAGILTDVAFIELRYSGKAAAFLRGFRSVYLGVFMNAVIIAWVNIALGSLLSVFFQWDEQLVFIALIAAMCFVGIYVALSGLEGVAVTDTVQFFIAMGGCIALAIYVITDSKIGGISGLKDALPASTFQFLPSLKNEGNGVLQLSATALISFIGFQWWAGWYPGSEPGGGGYVAQRLMSAKDEEHAIYSGLFFQVAHHALRPWPWILVGLASIVLYPDLAADQKRLGYVYAMRDFLPVGLKGLLFVAFISAYMSTISTQFNWGSSYLIHDFYKRFVSPAASEKKQLLFGRLSMLLLILVASVITYYMKTLEGAFMFVINCSAGLGGVLIMRWYHWRINAWSEISATIAPFVSFSVCVFALDWKADDPLTFVTGTLFTTVCWIICTLLTPPTDTIVLKNFYEKIKPGGYWGNFGLSSGTENTKTKVYWQLLGWLSSLGVGYGCLFSIGGLILGKIEGFYTFIGAIVSLLILIWALRNEKNN